jgi:hypothetical protein
MRGIKMVFKLKLGNKSSKKRNKKLTLERLNEVLYIDPEIGKCYWKSPTNRRIKVGDRAGCICKSTDSNIYYRKIRIDGKNYLEHILIWFFVTKKWPSRGLDHKNRNGLDNKIKNLRLCTETQNHGNTEISKNNTSGYKGVYWNKHSKKWIAHIGYKKERFNSKGYDDPYKAHQWYCRMHKKLFKEFSRTE